MFCVTYVCVFCVGDPVLDDVKPSRRQTRAITTDFTTTFPSTTAETREKERLRKFQEYYKKTSADEFLSDGIIHGIHAFNNNVRVAMNLGHLSVPLVSMMGTLTPICAKGWNEAAAKVFCKSAGLQVNQTWVPSYVSVTDEF